MIQVEMTDDIRRFQTKFMGPFTKRQLICLIIGGLCAVPVLTLLDIEIKKRAFVALFFAMPAIICGFAKFDGVNPEVLALRCIYRMLYPRRVFKNENEYRPYLKQIKKERENNMISQMSKRERKSYLKLKSKGRVKYSQKREYKLYK